MSALGWQFGPSAEAAAPAAPVDAQAVLSHGRGATESLQAILADPLCQPDVAALSVLSAAANECDKNINQENSLCHYAEVKRLQVTFVLLSFALALV